VHKMVAKLSLENSVVYALAGTFTSVSSFQVRYFLLLRCHRSPGSSTSQNPKEKVAGAAGVSESSCVGKRLRCAHADLVLARCFSLVRRVEGRGRRVG
jgi:hypothetical protein